LKSNSTPKHDTTSTRRQKRRREKLNQAAQELGFESWGKLETAIINQNVTASQCEKFLEVIADEPTE